MEDISTASATTAPKRDNALLNQSLDDIIKQNRSQRRNEKKSKPSKSRVDDSKNQNQSRNNRNNRQNKRDSNNNNNKQKKTIMMMDTTPVRNNIQKQRGQQRDSSRTGKLIVRSNSGRPHFDRADRNKKSTPHASSTPGLRQPWEKLPTAPLPAEPLKISIRNELADRPVRRSSDHPAPSGMMIDSEPISHPSSSYRSSVYEPRDALASRDEYRIGNRFATQGMAIDYQLPSGASFDTRPARRY